MRARYSGLQAATIVGLLISGAVSYVDFPSCEERVLGIIERGEVYGDIDNVTLEERGYRHHGIIHGLRPPLSSNTTVALTYAGITPANDSPVRRWDIADSHRMRENMRRRHSVRRNGLGSRNGSDVDIPVGHHCESALRMEEGRVAWGDRIGNTPVAWLATDSPHSNFG